VSRCKNFSVICRNEKHFQFFFKREKSRRKEAEMLFSLEMMRPSGKRKSGGEWDKESASFMTKPRQTSRQKKDEDSWVL